MSVRQGNKIIAGSAKAIGISIGTIFTAPYNNYTPEGAVLADGTEFDATQFPDLWKDYIQGGRLLTCTYQEFQQEIATKGFCYKFAVSGNKFKVPYVVDDVVGGTAGVKGNGITLGLTDGTTNLGIRSAGNGYALECWAGGYGAVVGNTNPPDGAKSNTHYLGVTTDPSKSGIVADLPKEPVKHYVQVASSSVNQSMMDWSRYMQGLEGKANTNLSNTDNALSENFLSKITPDTNRIISITDTEPITSSPTFYTAPVAGVFCSSAQRNPGGHTLFVYVNDILIYNLPAFDIAVCPINIFLNKNDKLRFTTDNASQTTWFLHNNKFIPLKGAK